MDTSQDDTNTETDLHSEIVPEVILKELGITTSQKRSSYSNCPPHKKAKTEDATLAVQDIKAALEIKKIQLELDILELQKLNLQKKNLLLDLEIAEKKRNFSD